MCISGCFYQYQHMEQITTRFTSSRIGSSTSLVCLRFRDVVQEPQCTDHTDPTLNATCAQGPSRADHTDPTLYTTCAQMLLSYKSYRAYRQIPPGKCDTEGAHHYCQGLYAPQDLLL